MDHFFTPNVEAIVQDRSRLKMTQSTINDVYKKGIKGMSLHFIRWMMYEAAIPFNAVTYPSFQPMIETFGQYGVQSMMPARLHEIRVSLKKSWSLQRMDVPLCQMDGLIGKEELR